MCRRMYVDMDSVYGIKPSKHGVVVSGVCTLHCLLALRMLVTSRQARTPIRSYLDAQERAVFSSASGGTRAR
jgi:hypothetical protein